MNQNEKLPQRRTFLMEFVIQKERKKGKKRKEKKKVKFTIRDATHLPHTVS